MKEEERTPLRTILTNFLNHIDTLENQRTPDNTYESEFQELKLFSESIKGTKQNSCSEGEKEVNRKKNRYKDILPFDVTRVVLNEYAGVPGSDYINANFIKGASGSPAYIASQGPLPHTVNDFWRMVVQCEVQVIVMACNEEEAGKHKCENYWVEGEGEEKQFGMVSLRLIKASTVCPDFSIRTMRLKYTNTQSTTEERTVCQFHYSAWPDHGVPPLVRPLLDMVRLVRDTQASETLPVLVHCSAGCGRTGTICAIDYVWGLLRAGKLTKDFSLLGLVREMRRQRIAMVQTKEQYVLVHQAVRDLFREQLRMIDSHPYENIDCNGLPLIKCPSPEPEYHTIQELQNNKIDEKQDEREKEKAPPLPQKKRFHTFSSKQAKEVENLSERQRLVEQAGSSSESVASSTNSSGPRPRIATLRSLFERQSRQVARSHSLGSVRPPAQTNPVEVREQPVKKPIPGQGILRVPQAQPTQKPILPVKRSKSLRVLGSSDHSKLSIPPPEPLTNSMRRLSLESNYDELMTEDKPLTDYLSVDSIVAGLGVRERRNSFCQAVNQEVPPATWTKKPGLLRSYTSVDMRSAREKPDLTQDAPAKPVLWPKPNLLNKPNTRTEVQNRSTILKQHFQNQAQNSPTQIFPTYSDIKRSQLQASSSRTLMTHSMSLRLAPRSRREDCRVLLSHGVTRLGDSHRTEQMHSSGESTASASSDPIVSSTKALTPKQSVKSKPQTTRRDYAGLESKDKQSTIQPSRHDTIFSPRSHNVNPIYREDKISISNNSAGDQSQTIRKCSVAPQLPPSRPQHGIQAHHQRLKSVEQRNVPPPQRPVVYDSKNQRQNVSGMYATLIKLPPPPYVEPGKNAEKPQSVGHLDMDKHNKLPFNDSFRPEDRQWPSSSSRDIGLLPQSPSTNTKNLNTSDTRCSPNTSDSSGMKYSRNIDKTQMERDYIMSYESLTKGGDDKRPESQDFRPQETHYSRVHELKYQEQEHLRNDKRNYDHEYRRSPQEAVSKHTVERHHDQIYRPNLSDSHSKSNNERRVLDKKLHQSFQDANVANTPVRSSESGEQTKSNTQDYYFKNLGDRRSGGQEYRQVQQEVLFSKDRKPFEQNIRSSPQEMNDRLLSNSGSRNGQEHVATPPSSYQHSSQELYLKAARDRDRRPQHVSQTYPSRSLASRAQDPAPQTSSKDLSAISDSGTPLSHGVKMRRGSRDDLALCGAGPSRVKRHASVVLLRHANPDTPLTVWSQANQGSTEAAPSQTTPPVSKQEDPWSGALGVDLDQVAASITSQKDGKMMRAALEALHLRKASQGTPKSSPSSQKSSASKLSQSGAKSSHSSPKGSPAMLNSSLDSGKSQASPPQFQPPPEPKQGPFRKQQQYL